MYKSVKFLIAGVLLILPLLNYAQTGAIRINQVGYYPTANKIAFVTFAKAGTFEIVDAQTDDVVFTGTLTEPEYWSDAGDTVCRCDFSDLTTPGTYKIRIQGYGESYPFEVSGTVLRKAAYASLKSYYYQRCSYELEEEYAGLWARAAGHPDTAVVLHSSTGKSGKISSPGGWYDAGDFGKYVINAGISVATMLSFYENFNDFFEDGSIHIPESGNGLNDLLDEVKYELDWLKTMQDEDGGVFFKLTTLNFAGFVMPANSLSTRYAIGKTTASALDFAAMMAMAGRIYEDYDAEYAADCIARAIEAWNWAKANPAIYFRNPSDVSTGEYGDNNVTDEFIWAAAELFITTANAEFQTYLEDRSSSLTYTGAPGWNSVRPLASLSLATRPNGLSESLISTIRNSIVSRSDTWLGQISSSPVRIPKFSYSWGSNSGIANIGVGMLYAYILSEDEKYIDGAAECADYILGKNGTGFSFVSSYGYKTPMNFHHRASGSDGIPQPVPGFVSGGPNSAQQDGERYPFVNPAKCFVDVVGSYASNEVCINWNSPLTVLLAGVDAVLGDQGTVEFEVPMSVNNPPALKITTPVYASKIGSDKPFIVKGTATDNEGISRVELYIDSRFIGEKSDAEFQWDLEPIPFGDHTATILAFDIYGLTSELTNQFTYRQVYTIPGFIEAEDYSGMSGISVQNTTDINEGKNVTATNTGDWFEYPVNITESGYFRAEYRVASSDGGGEFELRKNAAIKISSYTILPTGGAQEWITISDTVQLTEGNMNLRIHVLSGGWNMNWLNFEKVEPTALNEFIVPGSGPALSVNPNPVADIFHLQYNLAMPGEAELRLFDINGKLITNLSFMPPDSGPGKIDWASNCSLNAGIYYLAIMQNGQGVASCKVLKVK